MQNNIPRVKLSSLEYALPFNCAKFNQWVAETTGVNWTTAVDKITRNDRKMKEKSIANERNPKALCFHCWRSSLPPLYVVQGWIGLQSLCRIDLLF